MQPKFFSIVVVSLNPGERMRTTLNSILSQTFKDYEIVIKDGLSKDGMLEELEESGYFRSFPCVRIFREKDCGIYDGMNQAVSHVEGKYVQFLNCGDCFYDGEVLEKTARFIKENPVDGPAIYYGNQYNILQSCEVTSNPNLDDFGLFRNVPCHQVCFYDASLFSERGYYQKYNVRGDYEHFLYSVYEKKARTMYMPHTVCFYEGGGYSETAENRKRSKKQHKEITNHYMGKKAAKYRMIMFFSMAGLRTKLAESKLLSGPYNKLKSLLYRK